MMRPTLGLERYSGKELRIGILNKQPKKLHVGWRTGNQ